MKKMLAISKVQIRILEELKEIARKKEEINPTVAKKVERIALYECIWEHLQKERGLEDLENSRENKAR